ncbi:hypothetical protein WA158_006593 [Blastocystis sp. Blastoise]
MSEEMNPLAALNFKIVGRWNRARASIMTLPHGPVFTPVFMPVGTKGTIKGVTTEQMKNEPIDCQLFLGNTYHLSAHPGSDEVASFGGLHKYMDWDRNLLTDSGGFQMVSLLDLANITEEGVEFRDPVDGHQLLLTPEESIRCQMNIGADIMMALDDVVHSCRADYDRYKEATFRTVRWLDRCLDTHKKGQHNRGKYCNSYNLHQNSLADQETNQSEDPNIHGELSKLKEGEVVPQNLFPIVQGWLDTEKGGLRDICIQEFLKRDDQIPGYAIGGLAGGEDKESFCRVVEFCTARLPEGKPRYVMGVGYPLDILVCSALGADMYDCVYPTRTGRFGNAFIPAGMMRLKLNIYKDDERPIDENCQCDTCKHYSRSMLNHLLKDEALGSILVTRHNLYYMIHFTRTMRQSIIDGTFDSFCQQFMINYFPDYNYPEWAEKYLKIAGIELIHKH